MKRLRARLALVHRRWTGTRKGPKPTSPSPARQNIADRRTHVRLAVSQVPFVRAVRLRYGPAVTLIDLSSGGAQIEIASFSVQPGSKVIVEIMDQQGTTAIPAHVLRCTVASVSPLIYRAALSFMVPLDINEDHLGCESLLAAG
jgi:hypothetical protein